MALTHHQPTTPKKPTAVSPKAPHNRKPPPNRPLPSPLPTLLLPNPRPPHAPPICRHGATPVPVAFSAAAAREIMKTHDLTFSNRPKSTISDKFFYGSKDVGFSPYGEYWRQMKSICVLQLLSNKRVQSFRDVREEETAIMIEKITNSCSGVVNLSELVVELTGGVVCRAALGRKYGGDDDGGEGRRGFKEILGEFQELIAGFDVGDFVPWLKWLNRVNGVYGRVERVAKELDEFLESVIEEHLERERKGGERKQDLVDVLLEIQRENKEAGSEIHKDSVKALVLDIFSGGTDTTSSILEWGMTELLRHPQVMENLKIEVRGMNRHNQFVTDGDLNRMPYLKAVIKETLRLHPPVPLLVPRETTKDIQIMGYDIAVGTRVIVSAWAIGRDPLSCGRPEDFMPERFLTSSVDFRGHDFELIPFGAGRRKCPGIEFSMAVDELAFANLVHRFDFELPDGVELDVSEVFGLTVHKKLPLLVVATPFTT